MKIPAAILLFLVIPFSLFAQENNIIRCYTTELMQQQLKENPALAKQVAINEQALSQWINIHPDYKTRGVVTIPIVVHLLYNADSADQQLSDRQITSQIDAMNEDYSRENVDSLKTPEAFKTIAADCQIQFCLAQKDPDGNFTTGIVRRETGVTVFNDFASMKFTSEGGDDGWPYQDYMNVWVCNMGGGILGYTTLPDMGLSNQDGCVIFYRSFGRINQSLPQYNLGRTLTHESGHWLDLFHPWGNGGNCKMNSDSVADTPNQFNDVFGCPDFPYYDSCTKTFPGTVFMDYMEYVDDSCMNIFTTGQSQRMMATLNVYRPSILNSSVCNAPTTFPLDIGISAIPNPAMIINSDSLAPVITLRNFGATTLTSATIYYSRNYKSALHQYNWNGSLTSGETVNVSLPKMRDSSGYQLFIAYTKSPNGQQDADTTNDYKTRSYFVNSVLSDTNEPVEDGKFNIYPNPAGNSATIEFNFPIRNYTISDFVITNILGQREGFDWQVISSNAIKINSSNIPPSIYFVRVTVKSETIEGKLLIIR